jgi:DNA-binding NtrC family response regulator
VSLARVSSSAPAAANLGECHRRGKEVWAGSSSGVLDRHHPRNSPWSPATHRKVDLLLLIRVLEDTSGNQHQAAVRLGIGRGTLRRGLRELGLHVSRRLETEENG